MKRLIPVTVLAAACDEAPTPVPPDQIGSEWTALMCSRFAECCTVEELRQASLGGATETECREDSWAIANRDAITQALADSIASGRVVYDGARMAECFETLRSQACHEINALQIFDSQRLERCDGAFTGQVAPGGACAMNWDCVSLLCDRGMCFEPPADGEPCIGFRCGEGGWCDNDQDMPRCHTLLADGAECDAGYSCESGGCVNYVCGSPLECDGVD